MKKIGIIGAMGSEVVLLQQKMTDCKEELRAGRNFVSGFLGDREVVVVQSGIGKVNSALTAQILIDCYGVDAVINTGVAGGAGDAKVQDMVISEELTYHDMDLEILSHGHPYTKGFTADAAMVKAAVNACKEAGITCYCGRIATGDQFIDNKEVKDDIVARLSPYAVEMEGGAVAHVCAANAVPFVVVRSISDNADDDAAMSFDEFEVIAANQAAELVISMLKQL